MKKITILFAILCFTFSNQTQAQFASYSLDTDASEAANNEAIPSVVFALSSTTIDEGSATDVTLTATLDVLSSEAVTIDFSLSGTAVLSTDYKMSSQNITIAAGAKSGTLSISTNGLDDDEIEVLQTIILTPTITNATPSTEAVILNLLSDDNPTVTSITSADSSIDENGGYSVIIDEDGSFSVITATLDAPASKPTHIILDVTGNAGYEIDYAADYSSKGEFTISTVAGGNGAGAANDQFNLASGLYVDPSGNVYVADLSNHRVQKWAPGATTGTTVAGGNGAGAASNQLNSPNGIFVDTSGNLYIADSKNHRIQKWDLGASQGTTVAGGKGIGIASNDTDVFDKLNNPKGVFVTDDGNIYVADTGNNRIQKWTPGATSGIRVAGGDKPGVNHNLLSEPDNVFVTPSRDIYVADSGNDRIQKWREGSVDIQNATGWNDEGDEANQMDSPVGVFVDPLENMYIADYNNQRIQKWKVAKQYIPFEEGDAITVAGNQGQGNAANQFNGAKAIFVDVLGDLYVADMNNHRIQKYHYGPRITIPAGETTGTLRITALEDTSDDDDETIVITPKSVVNAISEDTTTHTVTITDDDEKPVISFEWSPESIEENAAKDTELVAKLSATSNKKITINFSVSGTATRTTEYTLSNTSIIIPAGVSSRNLTVSTKGLDDDDIEIAETIIFTVKSGLTNANVASNTTTLNLLSKDAPDVTSIIVDNTNIEESGGVSIVTATISAPTSVPTHIELDVFGTAKFIDDYVVDFSSKGESSNVAGAASSGSSFYGSAGSNHFNEPAGIFVDTLDNLYVADQFNQRVQKWAPGATEGITVAGTEEMGARPNAFVEPRGISVSADGFVYVADSKNHRIQKWMSGELLGITVAGGNEEGERLDQLNNPIGLHVDLSGNVYVADTYNHRIQKWTPGATSGITVAGGNGQGAAANQLNNPHGVYVDNLGNIYVADTKNHRVQKWELGGTEGTTIAGGKGEGDAANQLNNPEDIFIDTSKGIYIADTYNARVLKKEVGETEWTIIEVEGRVRNVYVSAKMNVYVSDKINNRIQKHQYFPEITILAGETSGTLTITALDDPSSASKGVYSRDSSSDDGDENIEIIPIAARNSFLSTEASETNINIIISDGSSLDIDDVVINNTDTVLAYPNPSDGVFEIAVPISEKEVSIAIYNIYGQIISKRTYLATDGKVNLDIKNQPIGVYLAKVHLEVPVTLKIVKK